MIKILFICHGNICRSPMSEFVMKDMVKRAGLEREIYVASAAVSREEMGNPVYPPAKKKLAEHGIGCEGHRARQMTKEDYAEYDYLIAMDASNLRLMERFCNGDPQHKVSLLLDCTDRPGSVADPWYTGNFDATWNDVNEGCSGLLAFLKGKHGL
ncbi:MAG: low molecular weight protein-tyrosine-phosphatase [Clostridia bacterium]